MKNFLNLLMWLFISFTFILIGGLLLNYAVFLIKAGSLFLGGLVIFLIVLGILGISIFGFEEK